MPIEEELLSAMKTLTDQLAVLNAEMVRLRTSIDTLSSRIEARGL